MMKNIFMQFMQGIEGGERIRFNLSYYNMHSQIAKVIKASLCKNVLLYSVCMKYKRRGYCFSAESARTLG